VSHAKKGAMRVSVLRRERRPRGLARAAAGPEVYPNPIPMRAARAQVLDVLPLADSVTKLAARCAYCGAPALFSLRIAADQRQEVVGGADKYAPVCRLHYAQLETGVRPAGPAQGCAGA